MYGTNRKNVNQTNVEELNIHKAEAVPSLLNFSVPTPSYPWLKIRSLNSNQQ